MDKTKSSFSAPTNGHYSYKSDARHTIAGQTIAANDLREVIKRFPRKKIQLQFLLLNMLGNMEMCTEHFGHIKSIFV